MGGGVGGSSLWFGFWVLQDNKKAGLKVLLVMSSKVAGVKGMLEYMSCWN